MPAKNLYRTDKEGVYLHIYNKGIEGRNIFNDEHDYKAFLDFLQDYLSPPKDASSTRKTFHVNGQEFRSIPHLPKNYFGKAELLAYSLTPDHFHLILHQIGIGSVEKFVRSLSTRYSIYFNKKHKRTGSLFVGPYKSIQVQAGTQLNSLTRYLHLEDGYSSYQEYLGKRKEAPWIKEDVVLSHFGKGGISYKDFVEKSKFEPDSAFEKLVLEDRSSRLERTIPEDKQYVSPGTSSSGMRMPVFLSLSGIIFVLLVAYGVRNIEYHGLKTEQLSFNSEPTVLSETQETYEPQKTQEVESIASLAATLTLIPASTPAATLTYVRVRTEDGISSVNIRKEATASAERIGRGRDGDTFEVISKITDWYEIKTASESVGFISAKYVEEENILP